MNKPSKYHDRGYVGKGINGADEYGYKYIWNSSHDDLEPTSVFEVGYQKFCSYCCKKAYPIQARLKNQRGMFLDDWCYEITGYTCICESAEKEKEYIKKQIELKDKHKQEEYELDKKYKEILKHNKLKRLEMKYQYDSKSLQLNEEYFKFND